VLLIIFKIKFPLLWLSACRYSYSVTATIWNDTYPTQSGFM